jgi:hypothetical protein
MHMPEAVAEVHIHQEIHPIMQALAAMEEAEEAAATLLVAPLVV